jgi:hypothetical protein
MSTPQQQFLAFPAPRLSKQKAALLARLREGPATNAELFNIAHRFPARLLELREIGNDIECKCISHAQGLYEYRLVQEWR